MFCVSFLFLGFINSVKAETPTGIIFQDNFDNDSLGILDGQNGWTPVVAPGYPVGSKQIQVGDQGNQLQIQAETSSYGFDLINQQAQVQDVRVKVDFQQTSSPLSEPDIWVRRSGFSGTGYWLLNEGGAFCFLYGGGVIGDCGNVSRTPNDWYTIEFQVVNNIDGNPVLSAWVYPQGTQRPDSPMMTYTDTANYASTAGYVALGTNDAGSVTNFDNFVIYSGDLQTAPTVPTNLRVIPQQNQISLTWNPPFNYGGSPILDYDIQYKTGSGSYITYTHTPNGALSSAVIPDLESGSSYNFKISAINAIGTSPSVTGNGKPLSNINITSPTRAVANDPLVATIGLMRTVSDQSYGNTCTDPFYIPYIQTDNSLLVSASVSTGALPSEGGVKFILDQGQSNQQILYSHSSPFSVAFSSVEKGEHTLDTYIVDSQNNVLDIIQHDRATNIGIGDIFGAIGDSVTDGSHGTVYTSTSDWVSASVKSNDGRNYSSCGDVAPDGRIEMNNNLENALGYPVFIFNEGVSGATSGSYVSLIQTSNWQSDIDTVKPNKWLIHLGINDGWPAIWAPNIQSIIDTLNDDYNAQEIVFATPAVGTGWEPYFSDLISANSDVILGPNFNTFYTNYPSLKYDSLHPTNAGQVHMGYLWANSISYPQNVSVSQNTGTTTLNWDSLSLESSILNTAGYKVSYGTSSETYTTTTDVGNVTTKDITGLTGGQTYYFTVSAYDNDSYSPNPTQNSPEVSLSISNATLIASFDLSSPVSTGTINNTNNTVILTVPYSTVITDLTPTITVSNGATILPTSGTAKDFTTPQTYMVTAQDGITTQEYVVTVIVASDAVAPTTTASAGSYTFGTWSNNNVAVSLTCDDGTGSGCFSTVYCIDTTNSCTPTTPYTSSVAISNGPRTSYIRYYSIDVATNPESISSRLVMIAGPAGGGSFYNPTPPAEPVVIIPTPEVIPPVETPLTPQQQKEQLIAQIKQQLIALITQLIQMLTAQLSQMIK